MAWIYKRGGVWWVGYRHNGKQILRSTEKADEKEARTELHKIKMMFEHHRGGSLTEELYRTLAGSNTASVTLAMELVRWIDDCQHHISKATLDRYTGIAEEFRAFLGATESRPKLMEVTTADVSRYLNHKRATVAASTANTTRKILAGFFRQAIPDRLTKNPVTAIKRFAAAKGEKVKKRSFTLVEMTTIYNAAPNDFWRYMITGEFYTGLRMGDLICLRWGAVDLKRGFITIEPDKTDEKELHIPIAKPFRAILEARLNLGPIKNDAHIWPEQAARHQRYKSGSGYFSNQFYKEILTPCGLVPKRNASHKTERTGRSARRQMNDVSFHCLRHSFVSYLKATGSNQSVAKELAGHSSDSVNDLYTHNTEEALTKAIDQLPEFVN